MPKEPHQMPSVPLPEQPGRTPVPRSYPARSKAQRRYFARSCSGWTPRDEAVAKAAFIEGWEARKRAQYNGDAS
jgi:hypothetical protein